MRALLSHEATEFFQRSTYEEQGWIRTSIVALLDRFEHFDRLPTEPKYIELVDGQIYMGYRWNAGELKVETIGRIADLCSSLRAQRLPIYYSSVYSCA